MLMISYRTKSRLKKAGIALGIVLLVAAVIWVCWMVWIQRFVIYTRDGIYLDFGRSASSLSGTPAKWQSEQQETMPLEYLTQEEASPELGGPAERFVGYAITTSMLLDDMDDVMKQAANLAPGSVVMLDVKSIYGNFYYSTNITGAPIAEAIDTDRMDELIRQLRSRDMYLIARVPAFCDRAFALEHISSALAISTGALWADDNRCFWLDPGSETVMANLAQICRELTQMGFREVVFDHFYFPSSGAIVYNASVSKADAVRSAAKQLSDAFTTKAFRVSFATDSLEFPLPGSNARLYLEGADPEQAEAIAQSVAAAYSDDTLVFLSESRDTRFEVANLIRPLG